MKNFRFLLLAGLLVFLSADRSLAAISVTIDYRFDTSGFFSDPARRAALETAVQGIFPRLTASSPSVTPNGTDTWSWTFDDPGTGAQYMLADPAVAADQFLIYATGAPLSGLLSESIRPDIAAFGSAGWLNSVDDWQNAIVPRAGLMTFDSNTNWSFSTSAPGAAEYDFLSEASHALFHLLGFSSGVEAFDRNISGNAFAGPSVYALMAAPVLLSSDGSHFAPGTRFAGQRPTMLPLLAAGDIQRPTALDFAALADMGYEVGLAIPEPSTWLMAGLGLGFLLFQVRRSKGARVTTA